MWLIRVAGAILVVALLVVVGLLLLPGDRVAAIAADQVKARTGRTLTIGGDVRVTLWPVLGIETGPVTVSNADWAGSEPMLTANSLSIGVSAPELLRGEVRIKQVVADTPVVRLSRNRDGRGNWEFGSSTGGTGETPPLSVEELRFYNAHLTYSEAGIAPISLDLAELALGWPDPKAPAEIAAVLKPFGDTLSIAARVEGFADFLAGGVSPLTAKVSLPGGQITFDGRGNVSGEASGRLSVAAEDSARMLAALGQGGVDLPRGLGRAAQVTTNATYTADGRLALRDLAMQLDQNRLSGDADIVLSDPPQVTARLTAGALDLTGLASGGGPAPAGSGWPKDRIDASALAAFNGAIALKADSIVTGSVPVGAVKATLEIDRSRAVLRLDPVSVFGGVLTGQLVANNRKGLSVAGRLHAEGIEMQQALGQTAGIERLSGKTSGDLEFLGSGPSVDAIMRSLKGGGRLDMGRGVISGFDLDQLLRSGTGTGGTTVFDSLIATYVIEKGDLTNDDLRLKLSRFTAEGEGRIGIGAQDIDYLFTPVKVKDKSGKEIAISVKVQGPWASPRITPDISKALEAEIELRRDELEAKAKQEATKKLEKELGVTVQDGQSVEDAVKKKLEDEAKKGILKLLGSN